MACTTFVVLSLCSFLLFDGCLAQLPWESLQQQQLWGSFRQQQKHSLRGRSQCQIERLNAQKPSRSFESEAGRTEFWDRNNEEFQCAGRGVHGTVIPGCAETFESQSQSRGSGERSRRFRDRHQKILRFREGDVLALPAGVAHWAYNDGDQPLISVSLLDTSNEANQLDQRFRKFFLAGNQQREQHSHGQEGRGQSQQERGQSGNIFNGFDAEMLAEAFNIDTEMVRKLQSQDDERGFIVRAERFQVVSPQWEEEEQERPQGEWNGLEETLCQVKLRENIGNPSRADVYNPRGGRISSLNSHKLPILNHLQLSAERGVLYRNAIMVPHWNTNAHSIIYVTGGSGRIQIVGNSGRSVFNDRVSEGQVVVVPQNFAVVKKASEEGLQWVAFKTNDNAMMTPLASRLSAIRAIPEEVLMNSYDISREDAKSLKYNRDEAIILGPNPRPSRQHDA
ncbi:hypothetical protein RJ640_013917 [Escallonia rubra]|uniref:Cupin type-1 domain-containing protein n=1 Tax=Escallonia rubra TaxID=112253 RepID=A0AA88UFT9_9ASTE|nr:hypothetical protein RJ640_013917 [Escallonia rubra]